MATWLVGDWSFFSMILISLSWHQEIALAKDLVVATGNILGRTYGVDKQRGVFVGGMQCCVILHGKNSSQPL